jgi:hypothetical protein
MSKIPIPAADKKVFTFTGNPAKEVALLESLSLRKFPTTLHHLQCGEYTKYPYLD